ncbi:MAG: ribonuclease D [Planctomycetota bacterium]|nr:ribonuclease D [Planctomycetota bacterium]
MSETPPERAPEGEPNRAPLPPPSEHDAVLVESAGALEELADRLATCEQVALDTEANSMHAYRERTCILQVTAEGSSAIVDVIAVERLDPLRAALDRSDVEIVLHGGDYDITVLTRDHDFRFERVFDTMIAATLLGDERVGLASLVGDHFGHTLAKRFQRADWARRPLTEDQLDYLQRDTLYLPALRAHYGDRLRQADLEEEAAIEFRRLARRRGSAPVFDPEGWRRIKGAGRLDGRGRAVLRALYLWREGQAEARDLPPFKVLGPKTMLTIAERPPRSVRSPRDVPALGDRERRRHGRALADVLRRALEAIEQGDVPSKSAGERPPPDVLKKARAKRNREERIKDWRRAEARRRGVPNAVVLPNPALSWLAETVPTDVAELAACQDIGPKRTARYGKAWVELLAR